jgi:predicted nucleotide-binding protein
MNKMANQNKTKKTISLLEQKRKDLVQLLTKGVFNRSDHFHYYFVKWRSETEDALLRIFGEDSRELKKFEFAAQLAPVRGSSVILSEHRRKTMLRAAAELEAILSSIKEYGIPEKQEGAIPPKAFIAHGGETAARDKVQDFLMALGVTPIIVEEQPSEGRSKDKNVEHYLKQCDCAIILATKGDVDGLTGEFIPRGNILIESGRYQEILPDRMIYLLEEGAKFPTDIDEKVWERFTKESMDKAFIKIAKELRAFGLIKAVKL